ncbi:MAG TPA: ATP-binding protein [Hyphomicrobiales bacterium]|nr:ATP-binding protein [Hyphomicrobiales bacterium]
MSSPAPGNNSRYSLQKRLVLAFGVLLILFLGLAGLVLERAYQESIEVAVRERLQLQIYALLGVAEPDRGAFFLPDLGEARFSQLNSGLYGFIVDSAGNELWRSASALTLNLMESGFDPGHLDTGEIAYGTVTVDEQGPLIWAAYGIYWESQAQNFTFVVLESSAPVAAEIREFQSNLYLWFGALAIFLSAAQVLLLRWGLRPLEVLAEDLSGIEGGRQDELQGRYPVELVQVTQNLNLLIKRERERQHRYRSLLGDLAHSLKTPLAVLSAALQELRGGGEISAVQRQDMEEQLARMDQIVSYQLKRAVKDNQLRLLATPVALAPVLARITGALHKVYRDKAMQVSLEVADSVRFFGEESDLMELCGNLLDNAFKYGASRIVVRAGQRGRELLLDVADDGPGIAPDQRAWVLERGARADTVRSGQGIGLAVVVELVSSYGGEIRIEQSTLGGALFRIRI